MIQINYVGFPFILHLCGFTSPYMVKNLTVIGGGAAGFFCAVNAAKLNPRLQVAILEKSAKLLSKVRISGGGRCNVTHHCFSIAEMVKNYPRGQHFVKKAFHHFFTNDTIEWFKQRGVAIKTEADGRMFPDTDSSETIIACLLEEAQHYGVSVQTNTGVTGVSLNENKKFVVALIGGKNIVSDYVCIACGGFPKLSQFGWIQELGHTIVPPVPSLFTFNLQKNNITSLMGVSVPEVNLKIKGTRFQQSGPLLITHWGLSGPAILKLSAFASVELAGCNYEFTVIVNWTGNSNEHDVLNLLRKFREENAKKKIRNKMPVHLPQRFWEYQLEYAGIDPDKNWADLPARQQNLMAKNLSSQEFAVKGKTTFKEEFVTAGGVSLSEITPSTMESRMITGLYFAGEIMDVDGITGGFNFQHAWTSGFVAASAIARAIDTK